MHELNRSVARKNVCRQQLVIGVCTFRRPTGLESALDGILRQSFKRVPEPDIHIIVIDNDADRAIQDWVSDYADRNNLNITYVAESARGISQARNCFLRNVPSSADLVAFLDDDEVPVENWLDELIYGLYEAGADAISGPVIPEFKDKPPKWMTDGKFFMAPRRKDVADYEKVGFGVMGNFLMKRSLLDNEALYFPEELGFVGSEDKYFFSAIQSMNVVMSWASKAVAFHQVPPARMRLSYLLKREFRVGCGRSLVLRMAGNSRSTVRKQAAKDLARLMLNVIVFVPATVAGCFSKNSYDRVKRLIEVYQFAGRCYGLLGLQYKQYR